MTTWCLVPARGGSKGLPGKNLRKAGGLSLVARAVHAARQFALQVGEPQVRVIVDTDDPAIAAEALAWGAEVPFLRAAALAGDAVGSVETVLGFFDRLAAGAPDDIVVLLQPTSPLRQADDIALVWHAVAHAGAESAAAVAPTTDRVDFALLRDAEGRLSWLAGDAADGRRRQDACATMHLTGAVYAIRLDALRRTRKFVASDVTFGVPLPESGAVDVDTADDLALADLLLRRAAPPAITLRDRTIGRGEPCFVIAAVELGDDHDDALAERSIAIAAESGADAIVFRRAHASALSETGAAHAALHRHEAGAPPFDFSGRTSMPLRLSWARLAASADARAIRLIGSPTDAASAGELTAAGVAGCAVAYADLTNHALLAALAAQGMPIFLAIEDAEMARIADALLTIRRHHAPSVVLMACAHPAGETDAAGALSALGTLSAAFRVATGWRDSAPFPATSIAAAALGASALEIPLGLTGRLIDRSPPTALAADEFAALVRDLRIVQGTPSGPRPQSERIACVTSS